MNKNMKKNIFKLFSALAVSAPILTGCIEETFPESGSATSEQIGQSTTALEAALNGIPSQMVEGYMVYNGYQVNETDISYPGLMLVQSELMGDIVPGGDYGYDWWSAYHACLQMNAEYYYSYIPYFTLYQFIKSANDVISAVDLNDTSLNDETRGLAGVAYACRAFDYYLLTVLFEPVENIYTDCSNVLGLTVPIVTESTTNEQATNNPRVTHEAMIEFILSDLAKAEELLAKYTPSSKNFPDLSVVYGLMAKVYLLDEKYEQAATYARKAIETNGGTPMTESQWLDVNTGFNTASSGWMWYLHPTSDQMGNLANFIGHISGEAGWGYGTLSMPCISRTLYDHMADTDFRKHAWLDPERDTYNYQSPQGAEWLAEKPDYFSLKFRCSGGDVNTYTVGAEADIPVMRIEEMYLIEAEAVGASQGVAAGVALLNSFMQTYRQPDYNFTTTDLRDFQLEVLTQMRIEFWGEGTAFPTAKRLKPDVIQNYDGTNEPVDILRINCKDIKPNWTLVIPIDEMNANTALKGLNNPDPSSAIPTRPTPVGTFAPGRN